MVDIDTVEAEIITRKKFVRIRTSRRPTYNLKCALILRAQFIVMFASSQGRAQPVRMLSACMYVRMQRS